MNEDVTDELLVVGVGLMNVIAGGSVFVYRCGILVGEIEGRGALEEEKRLILAGG